MKNARIITVIGVVILVTVIGTFLINKNNVNKVDKSYQNEGSLFMSSVAYAKEKVVFDKMANATVTSKDMSNDVIPANATFEIDFDKDVSKEYVENSFSIKPSKNLEVVEYSPKHYSLKVNGGLEEDQIYNIEEKTTAGTYKWAFQTEKVFKVEYTYPDENSFITETGTPEIAFNGKIASNININDYITISPSIDGTWKEMYSYNYHFEHNKHFEKDKTYEITIKKGLKDVDGNALKEDYTFKFSISNENEEDISANLEILNVYKPNSNIDLTMNLYMNLNKALSINEAKLKILNLGSKEEFINAIKNVDYIEKVNEYNTSEKYAIVFEKDLKDIVTNEYNKSKAAKLYWYSDEVPLNLGLQIAEQGYYMAILDFNSNITTSLFQVNDSTASVSNLSQDNFMILYKGPNGKNNSVDIYLNGAKLATTNEEGFLYLESFRKVLNNIDKEVNYLEFKTGNKNLVYNISNQVYSEYEGENKLTSYTKYNNGYVYVDRNSYKPGETLYYWGYAKNRKVDVKNATLKITSNWDDVLLEAPLKLDDTGTFYGEYTFNDVDKESYISLDLYIGDSAIAHRNVQVRDYELKQYNITITPESKQYLDGDTAVININAETYDGTPLKDLDFKYAIGSNYYYYDDNSKKVDGTVTTDEFGNATIKVPLKLEKQQSNIMPETVGVTILNSYIDGEQAREYFTVYPYKHYAEGNVKFIVDENKYHIDLKEYLSLDKDTPANDSIKISAKAYKTVRKVTGTRYNKYTKEMEDIVEYDQVSQAQYDKTFTVTMKNGKGEYILPKYSEDKNCYYRFYAYLITDSGKELALSYGGEIYSYSYKTIYDENQYEEVEFVDPIINQELTYNLRYDTNDKLKVGDEVRFFLQDENGKRISDYSKFEFYTLVVSAYGNQIVKNKGEQPHFVFTKEMGANVSTYTVCYDTLKAYVPTATSRVYYSSYMIDSYFFYPSETIKLCDEELSLKVDVKFDKDAYEPKDVATLKIKVTDNGKGVKAGINVSALDTAFIDANGQVDSNILGSLINDYYINSSSTGLKQNSRGASKSLTMNSAVSAKAYGADMAMVEEAAMADSFDDEANDESATRDDLRITAFFESIETNENGEAELKIQLPDNITEWTIKVQAISNGFKAKAEEKKIKVSKDFFVNVNHKDRYLVGEEFAFNIKSFSKPYAGKDVTFNIEIQDEEGKTIEKGTVKAKAQDVLSYKVKKPIDKVGNYKLKITGTCNGVKDILIDDIEVVDSLLDALTREDLEIKVGDKITIVSNKGYIYILNKDVAKILPTLLRLTLMYNANRNDTTVISNEAGRIFNNLCNGKEFEYSSRYAYNMEDNIFKVMSNSSDDARLALRMLATKSINISSEKVAEKIEVRLGQFATAWAKANMNMISLKELKNLKAEMTKNSSSYKVEDALYLSLAFADLGSFDEANEIYNLVKSQINSTNEFEKELQVILAIKLNLSESENLYNKYLENEDNMLPENIDFVKLYYVQNALDKNFTKGSMTLLINGKDEEVEVSNVGLSRKLIAGKDDIKVKAMTDNLKLMIEQYKPVDFKSIDKKNYIVSKSYNNNDYKEGDIVEVSITLDNKKMYNDGFKYGFRLEDSIPNNMTFVEYIYGKDYSGYLRKQDGQKLTISYWNPYDPKWNPSATKSIIKYKVRVTNNGEQYEPGTIMTKYTNEIIDGIK